MNCRILTAIVILGLLSQIAVAQPYDSSAVSRNSYQYHEGQRQDAIRRQVGLNEAMKNSATAGGYGGSFYYGFRPSLDYQYAYPTPWSLNVYPYDTGTYGAGGPGPSVFEPWPMIPGDIWGYPYIRTVPQPIGQRQFQSGPNRWESHPIYAEPWLNSQAAPGPFPVEEEPFFDKNDSAQPPRQSASDATAPRAETAPPKPAGSLTAREF